MTSEAQRIAIAEACPNIAHVNRALGLAFWNDRKDVEFDPLNDLNAMHAAESRFIGQAQSAMTYAMHLLRVRGIKVASEHDDLNADYCWHACHATAAQRAEAFLRTLNLWKE